MKDYAELVLSATAMSGDSDVPNYAETMVVIAEKKLSRVMRVRQAIKTISRAANSAGTISLPRDFIDIVSIVDSNGRRLYPSASEKILNGNDKLSYAIIGDRIHTNSPGENLSLSYFEELPTITEHGCNWLLEQAPDIYLQSLLQEIALKNGDYEKAREISNYLNMLTLQFISKNKISVLNIARGGLKLWP